MLSEFGKKFPLLVYFAMNWIKLVLMHVMKLDGLASGDE
jgi:hypothetical protein